MAITFYDDILSPKLVLGNSSTAYNVSLAASTSTTEESAYILPTSIPSTSGKVLSTNSEGVMSWVSAATGSSDGTSRAGNLVNNFNGVLEDDTNFSQFTFTDSYVHNSVGAFVIVGETPSDEVSTDEFIPVEPTERYILTTWARSVFNHGKYYMGIRCYDSDSREILDKHNKFRANTTTFLAADLEVNDTFILVNALSYSWYTGILDAERSVIFWDEESQGEYNYPAETYSRNFHSNVYSSGAENIDVEAKKIMLTSPWAGPVVTSGTFISNGIDADNAFAYCMPTIKNDYLGTDWTKHVGYIGGLKPAGIQNSETEHVHQFSIGTVKGKGIASHWFTCNKVSPVGPSSINPHCAADN